MSEIFSAMSVARTILNIMGLKAPETFAPAIPIDKTAFFADKVCLLTVDSLGSSLIKHHKEKLPFVSSKNDCSYTLKAEMPCKTAVNLLSQASGLGFDYHGVITKDQKFNAETVFDIMRKCSLNTQIVCCENSTMHILFKDKTYKQSLTDITTDEAVAELLFEVIKEKHIDFIWCHLLDFDKESHRNGPLGREAASKIAQVDFLVKKTAALCKENGYTLFLNADHGHHIVHTPFARGIHDGSSDDDLFIPFMHFTC